MGKNKRRLSELHATRGVGILEEALQSGSILHGDEDGAANVLRANIPGLGRQNRGVQLALARRCMSKLSSGATPTQVSTVPRAPEPDAEFNSNYLLPSIRPRSTPPTPSSTVRRKRRRLRNAETAAGDADAERDREKSYLVPRPRTRLLHMGGVDAILETVRELTEWPLHHPEIYSHLGVEPPRGILLHGPAGCGKTLLAHAIAGELGVSFLRVTGPEIVSSMSGESERKLRSLFAEARQAAPAIIFIDEIDAIASRKEGATKDMERRIVSQLLSCIGDTPEQSDANETPQESVVDVQEATADGTEELNESENAPVAMDEGETVEKEPIEEMNEPKDAEMETLPDAKQANGKEETASNNETTEKCTKEPTRFIVIAATNRPESIEPALRRAGRFDREIELGAPDEDARVAILKKLTSTLRLSENVDFQLLARRTAGCVGADLDLLVREAGMCAVRRFAHSVSTNGTEAKAQALGKLRTEPYTGSELSNCTVTMDDMLGALGAIQPSALREGFAVRPDVTWEDIGALEGLRSELAMAVVEPIRRRALFDAIGLRKPAGVLLYGPPGCGKTLLARAVASESGANFISVKGPELLSRYVGDSELAVRQVFARARASAPSVIFFDELDALAPRRGGGASGDSRASERVVNMLLTEMDGFAGRHEVFLVAATNRPDIIDSAMLRPGRLDKLLYVPLPSADGRVSILRKLSKSVALAPDVDLAAAARDPRCEGLSGADLGALLRAACECAVRDAMKQEDSGNSVTNPAVQSHHLEYALANVTPSVSVKDAKVYANMERRLRASRAMLREGSTKE